MKYILLISLFFVSLNLKAFFLWGNNENFSELKPQKLKEKKKFKKIEKPQKIKEISKLKELFASYKGTPSYEKADVFISEFSKYKHIFGDLNNRILEDFDLDFLERESLETNAGSIKILFFFEVNNLLDGYFAENLDIALGRVAQYKPGLFLRFFKENKFPDVNLWNLGYEFVDEQEKSCNEMQSRYEAIKNVSYKELQDSKRKLLFQEFSKDEIGCHIIKNK